MNDYSTLNIIAIKVKVIFIDLKLGLSSSHTDSDAEISKLIWKKGTGICFLLF